MDTQTTSFYSEFFRAGRGQPRRDLHTRADFLGVLTAVEHFQHDIRRHTTRDHILQATQHFLNSLDLFDATAFYLVNPATSSQPMR